MKHDVVEGITDVVLGLDGHRVADQNQGRTDAQSTKTEASDGPLLSTALRKSVEKDDGRQKRAGKKEDHSDAGKC